MGKEKVTDHEEGFTLLELIISITLISVILLILSMGVRTGLRAYERARMIGSVKIFTASFLNLLERQIMMIVSTKNPDTRPFYYFRGDPDGLVFSTTISPQGTAGAGIILSSYHYDKEEKRLSYCQKILTRVQDLKDASPPEVTPENLDEIREEGWDCTVAEDVGEIQFRYTSKKDVTDITQWDEEWHALRALPVGILVGIKARGDEVQEGYTDWRTFFLDETTN